MVSVITAARSGSIQMWGSYSPWSCPSCSSWTWPSSSSSRWRSSTPAEQSTTGVLERGHSGRHEVLHPHAVFQDQVGPVQGLHIPDGQGIVVETAHRLIHHRHHPDLFHALRHGGGKAVDRPGGGRYGGQVLLPPPPQTRRRTAGVRRPPGLPGKFFSRKHLRI